MTSWASIAKEGIKKDEERQQTIEKRQQTIEKEEKEFFEQNPLHLIHIKGSQTYHYVGFNEQTGESVPYDEKMIKRYKQLYC